LLFAKTEYMINCKISSVKLISFVIESARFIYHNGYTGNHYTRGSLMSYPVCSIIELLKKYSTTVQNQRQ